MSMHILTVCEGPQTTLEVVEETDFFAPTYLIREQDSGRIVRQGISSRRSAVAVAEAVAAAPDESEDTA